MPGPCSRRRTTLIPAPSLPRAPPARRVASGSRSSRRTGASKACVKLNYRAKGPRMAELLRIESLRKTYAAGGGWSRKRVAALNNVSLRVEHGKTLGLVGESGSGKSTLGKCVLGLIKPDGGSIRFDGAEVAGLRGRARAEFRRRVQPV